MSEDFPSNTSETAPSETASDMKRCDDHAFTAEIEALLKESENLRLNYMRHHRNRGFVAMTLGLLCVLFGASAFGWFLLVEANLLKAIASMILAVTLPIGLNIWSDKPLKTYVHTYKSVFMPKMAKALGGLKFHPNRGVSAQILGKTGIFPAYKNYHAEDCFMGRYKGVKVIFSEARLLGAKKGQVLFNGLFALLEIPHNIIEGHTIITADSAMVQSYETTRWKKLSAVQLSKKDPAWVRFKAFSDKPDAASLLATESLLKELCETADIFDDAPLSAVLFRKKYIFITIPYARDMFEASNIHIPITTKDHALNCKKEIEKLLEIIDIFDIYKPT